MTTRLLEMLLTTGGQVTFNPDQVVRLAPAGSPDQTDSAESIVWLVDGTHYNLACSYEEAMSAIQGTEPEPVEPEEPEPEPEEPEPEEPEPEPEPEP
jgi:hypothetical protein